MQIISRNDVRRIIAIIKNLVLIHRKTSFDDELARGEGK